ncbi:SLBB domain-containing protein [Pedobacter sp. Leaf250]|uniref:SLBB domain-containing protein n=1 Tax=Pedobacter sp. Leaf250 TaxID=2876559 RepID=UPI001E3AAE8B|nr:SLBB domain-containing protein [Pedobacter sp. Leaf250]
MKFKNLIKAFLFFSFLLLSHSIYAQTNYADVRVDELSDAKIRELMQRAESIGYSDAQLEQLALAQGMKQSEIEKLRMRVEKIRKQDGTQNNNSEEDPTLTKPFTDLNRSRVNSSQSKIDSLKRVNSVLSSKALANTISPNRLKIFGEELFGLSTQTFEPNLRMATPKSYVVGPDDELLIDITGDNEVSYKSKVSPDGNIRVQYIGLISVAGLTIEQATSKIKSTLSTTYPALRSGRTAVSITLGNIRSITVTIVGEAVKPGSYTVSSLASLFNILSTAGGPNVNGTYRNIQIVRGNKVINTIDIYDFLMNGIQKGNIRLQDQDVINIPVYNTRIELSGEVKRPAFFEIKENETLADALRFAGGFSSNAYSAQIKVLQNTNRERKIMDVTEAEFSTYKPQNGDKFIVERILDRFANRVEISGAVFRPGQYELDDQLTLKSLIQKADGVKEDAFLNRGYISRLNTDNSMALVSFDLAKILAGTEPDIKLQREDKVVIKSIFELREDFKVTVQGEVRQPGTFAYADGMNLEALIQMSGGFREGATPNRIEISRRIKNSDATSASAQTAEVFSVNVDPDLKIQQNGFTLKPFDIVSIRSSESYHIQRQIKIEGEVLYPGVYTIIKKDERISDIIKRAGGLSPLAYVEGASLRRNGKGDLRMDSLETLREDREKLLNLQRLKQSGARDTTSLDKDLQILRSDLVGIDLKKIMEKPLSRYDLIVENEDVIRVPKELQTIRVTGEVLKPNSIVYTKGKSFTGYISGSGGFSYNAYKKGAFIVYSNGSVAANRKFLFFNNFPQVKPGSEIFVPKRAEREKLNATAFIGISTAVASLAAIIVTLLR